MDLEFKTEEFNGHYYIKLNNSFLFSLKEINFKNLSVKKDGDYFFLHIDNQQYMAYELTSHKQAYELYNHFYFAKGEVITTGLGFGIRESWILRKPEVTSLTIIEKNRAVIDYHLMIDSLFLKDKRVKIIHEDAGRIKLKCDVLLADHFPDGSNEGFYIQEVKKTYCNIDHQILWFWPLENIIKDFDSYQDLKSQLKTLPKIDSAFFNIGKDIFNGNI